WFCFHLLEGLCFLALQPFCKTSVFTEGDFECLTDHVVAVAVQILAITLQHPEEAGLKLGFEAFLRELGLLWNVGHVCLLSFPALAGDVTQRVGGSAPRGGELTPSRIWAAGGAGLPPKTGVAPAHARTPPLLVVRRECVQSA